MNKILLIIKREYFSRVKKRSFIVMTILGPILMAAMFIVPVYIATQEGDTKKVGIVDETGMFQGGFPDTESLIFTELYGGIMNAKEMLSDSNFYAIIYIPATEVQVPSSAYLYTAKQPSLNLTSYIKSQMSMEIEKYKLQASGVDPDIILSAKTSVNLSTFKIDSSGNEEKSFTEVSMIVGWVGGFLIYIFIFMYGAQVMRGVIEEKTSRIVEIIISSVKPFQLMMGKIIGIALVGLTQFVLWVLFTGAIVLTFTAIYADQLTPQNTKEILMSEQNRIIPDEAYDGFTNIEPTEMNIALEAIQSINFGLILAFFIFFFIGGYLLYAALFASIG